MASPVFAESAQLLPASFVEIDNGNLAENTLLASDEGNIFIEFSKETKFINAEGKINFTGEILPPQKIELDIPKPRGMMRELITFEMVSNSGADILFLDKYDKITRKNLFRQQLLNPDGLKKSAWVKLIYLIEDENVKLPKLWEWQGEEAGWQKLGGNLTEAGETSRILSAILRRTGIYTIFDGNPAPEHFADEYEVYPKRPYTGPYADEFEDISVNEDLGFAIDFDEESNLEEDIFAGFHSSGEPPEIEESAEIPSVQATNSLQALQDLQKNVAENSAKLDANPEMKQKINDLVKLINENSTKKQKIDKLNAELNTISFALSRATNEVEKENLEKTFLELQTNLYALQKKDEANEAEFLTLEEEINDFFAGITLSDLGANSFDNDLDRNPPENGEAELYIPENATLVQSGAEDSQKISWGFPVFLLVCFGILGFGIFSTKKKKSF